MILLILLWKNLVLIKRQWVLTVLDFVLPIVFASVLVMIKMLDKYELQPEAKQGRQDDMFSTCRSALVNVTFFYCPDSGLGEDLGDELEEEIGVMGIQGTSVYGVEGEAELRARYTGLNKTTTGGVLAVIVSNSNQANTKHFEYTIKYSDHMQFSSKKYCFQMLVDFAIMSLAAPRHTDLSFQAWSNESFSYVLEGYPTPRRFKPTTLQVNFQVMFSLLIGMAYTVLITLVGNGILDDKCSGVTELMKIMGMKRWMVWVSWMLKVLMVHMIVVVLVVILLKAKLVETGPVLPKSDVMLLYIFILLYIMALTCFMFAITAVFYHTVWGDIAVVVLCLVTLMGVIFARIKSRALQWTLLLFPNVALVWGAGVVAVMEMRGTGATWRNCSAVPGEGTEVTMLGVLLLLIADIVLYFLLAYYIEAVRGGLHGIPEPWYYPVNKLMQMRKNKVDVDRTASTVPPARRPSNYEQPSVNDKPGICIDRLRKVYPTGRTVAVDGVILDIYKGQITALLGHNGAGKTTMMNVITGMSPPSSGTVWVNGFNIYRDLEGVRRSLGLCMQADIFFKHLSVMENLTFVGLLKGNSWKTVRAEAHDLTMRLDLKSKANSLPNQLSVGQKRKLSLCVALIGGSEVVILDEPTSGMDPQARRTVWDLLLAMRGHRTILITTHYMEEADALGDKVAIMNHGQVVCYGTSLYLKNKFGGGFKLTMIVVQNSNVAEITRLVESSVSGSELKSQDGAQLMYLLPASHKVQYVGMFDALERMKVELGIVSMGVSAANMDDVFLAVGKQWEEAPPMRPSWDSSLYDRVTGLPLIWQQFVALLNKKLTYMVRKWIFTLVMTLLPILGSILTFTLSQVASAPSVRVYSVNTLDSTSPVVYYSAASDPISTNIGDRYKAVVRSQGGAEPHAVTMDDDIRVKMLEDAYESPREFFATTVAAGEIVVPRGGSSRRLTVMYGELMASKELSFNLMNNAVLRYRTDSNDYSIKTKEESLFKLEDASKRFLEMIFVVPELALMLFVGSFMWLPTVERVTCGKQIQTMTGASVVLYWLSCFLLDFLLYMIVLVIVVVILVCFDAKSKLYSGPEEIGVLMFLFTLYGVAQIAVAYLFSCMIDRPAIAFTVYMLVHILLNPLGALLSFMSVTMTAVFTVTPHGCIYYFFNHFLPLAVSNNQCNWITEKHLASICYAPRASHPCCKENRRARVAYMDDGDTRDDVKWMAIDGAIFWVLFVIVESGVLSVALRLLPIDTHTEEEDDDVRVERERVLNVGKDGGEDMLIACGLAKRYGLWRKTIAVRQVTLGVLPGECFGLLGTNGAGKTTTFKMLTGSVRPTRGDARICQFRLKAKTRQYLKQIGYCPQQDAILEELTAREILALFALLRGIPKENTEEHVDLWVQQVGLGEYEHKPCGTYSGGNKRKLSTAIALIGDPPVVFLDEPTSGIDPVARRSMWGILTTIQKGNNCIVLTSQSMDECEALCNRLSIQVNGELKCIGSIPYLKQKFGQGFSVIMRLKDTKGGAADVDEVRRVFTSTFFPCELRDEHGVLLQYHVSNPSYTWTFLFENMEDLKNRLSNIIEDYSLSETSLEEIFLSFAKASK